MASPPPNNTDADADPEPKQQLLEKDDDDDDDVLDPSEQTQRPVDHALHQQRLNAWHPVLDPVFVIVALFYLGIILIPVGS